MQYNVNGAPWCCSMWPQTEWGFVACGAWEFTCLASTSSILALRTNVDIQKV
jgi:hypothetical protein